MGPCLALAALLAATCVESTPDARSLFAAAAARIEEHRVFEYSFEYREVRESGEDATRLQGTVTLERLDLSGSNYRARVIGGSPTLESAESRLDVTHDGETIYTLDRDSATVWFSPLAAAGPSLLVNASPALMYPFFDPRSLAGEAQATAVASEGVDTVGGVRCESIRVSYDDDEEDSRWCIGEDSLPRLMEWIGATGTRTLEITELATSEALPDARFAPEVPDGFSLREAEYGPPFGSPAPEWTLPLLGGGTVSQSELLGRVVFLEFWATWCPPCWESLAALDHLRAEMSDRPISFFAVNTMEDGDPAAFVEEREIGIPVLLEGDGLHDHYASGNLPAFVVIDAAGRSAGFGLGYFGERSERHARRLLERALSSDSRAP